MFVKLPLSSATRTQGWKTVLRSTCHVSGGCLAHGTYGKCDDTGWGGGQGEKPRSLAEKGVRHALGCILFSEVWTWESLMHKYNQTIRTQLRTSEKIFPSVTMQTGSRAVCSRPRGASDWISLELSYLDQGQRSEWNSSLLTPCLGLFG